MAFISADRVLETTATVGTGPLALGGAVSTDGGFRTFAATMTVGGTCEYCIKDSGTNIWEVGLGTYSAANTLTRTTVYASSNANSAISLPGNASTTVFITLTANRVRGFVYTNPPRIITVAGTVTVSAYDDLIVINQATGAAISVALEASPAVGVSHRIKDGKGDAATNFITLVPNAGTIDGAPSYVIKVGWYSATVTYSGTEWSLT